MNTIARVLVFGVIGIAGATLFAILVRVIINSERLDAVHMSLPFG